MPEDYGWKFVQWEDAKDFVQFLFKNDREEEVAIDFWKDDSDDINIVICGPIDETDTIVSMSIDEFAAFYDLAKMVGTPDKAIAYALEYDFDVKVAPPFDILLEKLEKEAM